MFNTEERRILQEARKWLEEVAPVGTLNPEGWSQESALDNWPGWDFNAEEGWNAINRYQDAILWGLHQGAKRPTNMLKMSDVTQDGEEMPGNYEQLCKAFHIYTPFDPEAPENQWMVNAAFMAQSAADIRCKFQKLEGFTWMNITQLLEIANKVYCNQDNISKPEAEKKMKQKVNLLAVALQQDSQLRGKTGWSEA